MYYNMKAHSVPLFFVFFCLVNSVQAIVVGTYQDANLNYSHPTMQDVVVAQQYGAGKHMWGVYDGHGTHNDAGAFCAQTVADDLTFCVPRFGWDAARVAERYVELDNELAAAPGKRGIEGGTTATTVLFDGVDTLDVVHAGDCRVLVGNAESGCVLTYDHSLLDPAELRRVIAADAGDVFLGIDYTWEYMRQFAQNRGLIKCYGKDEHGRWYAPRLSLEGNGDLNVVRTIGDRRHRNALIATPVPEITRHTLTPRDEFLIMVSDGITEVMSNQDMVQLVSLVTSKMPGEHTVVCALKAAQALVMWAKRKGSTDNLSALVVLFDSRKGGTKTPETLSGSSTSDESGFDTEHSPVLLTRGVES